MVCEDNKLVMGKPAGNNAAQQIDVLYITVRKILADARRTAYRAINFAMVQAYWEIGRLIVEEEQSGAERADYGKALIKELSARLTKEFGKGFSPQSLWNIRQFYLTFRNLSAPQREFDKCSQSPDYQPIEKLSAMRRELTWTHYKLMMRVENEEARLWYMNEAADCHWSTRQLERQINTLYYERLLASRENEPIQREAEEKLVRMQPEQFIRDPYVLEFLDIKDRPSLRESDLETALIDSLQEFLLELGKGFSFVARQRRIRLEDEDFYIDLIFYNYILKCFVLIDLKLGKLTHQDIGQMDTYMRIYEEHFRVDGDNPTIGIILCSEKNEAVVRYSVLNESRQMFASKYKLYLPSEEELRLELQRERRQLEETPPEQQGKEGVGHGG